PGTTRRTNPPRAPPDTLVSVPVTTSSTSRPATGIPGHAIAATSVPQEASMVTSSRRVGTRSISADSSVPPTRNGRNPTPTVSDARSGEALRWYTSTVRATAETTDPQIEIEYAMNSARNSPTANASR